MKCLKIVRLIAIFMISLLVFGCDKNTNKELNDFMNIKIIVLDNKNNIIYSKEKTTNKQFLVDALKTIEDLDVETENGKYGEYIISIEGLKQDNNYYWNYYINDKYAEVGISNYKIKDDDVFMFKIEKFE